MGIKFKKATYSYILHFHASCRANGRIARHISITKSGKLHTCRPYATQISRHVAIYFLLRQVAIKYCFSIFPHIATIRNFLLRQVAIVLIRTFFLIEDQTQTGAGAIAVGVSVHAGWGGVGSSTTQTKHC